MSTPINIKTFLLGDAPKNNPLTIQEMDQNLLNLKTAIQTVEDSSTTLVNDMVSAEALARQAADNSERDFRIAGDAALDTRLDVVETSYVKKDGTVAMTGLLTLSSNIPLNQFNATPKIYVDKATPEFSEVITLSGNLTISATNFLTVAANNLYIFPNTASASWIVTLPSPTSVPVGSRLHFYSQFALSTSNLIISAPSNTIRSESSTTSFTSSLTIYTGNRYTLVSDGSYWIPYKHFTHQQSSNTWNNSPVLVSNTGSMWGGKSLNLTSSGNVGFTSNFSINTDGTKLNIAQDDSNTNVLLSIDRATGKVIQNTNAPITEANQLITRDYADKNVSSTFSVITKTITSTNIQTTRGVSKPYYTPLVASDFGNIIKYVMTTKGVANTSLPLISSLGAQRRIRLVNASCDTLPQFGSTVIPGFAINASINIYPSIGSTDKIIGTAIGGVYTPNGIITLEAGDSAELIAVSNTEWMLISHSSMGNNSRLGIQPYNGLMFICRVKANGTIESYIDSTGETRKYLWTRTNSYLGNGAGITVTVTKSSTAGSYGISWDNPNQWGGDGAIIEPMIFANVNFFDSEPVNLSYSTKVQSLDSNSCNVAIKRTDTLAGIDAPFVVAVYGRDV